MSDMSRDDEIDELIMYVTDLRHSFTRKLDDHLCIIQDQNDRIRNQQRTIAEQKEVVDELAWQIRDLRDSVRRVKESVAASNGCVGCQQNKSTSQKTTNNNQQRSVPQAAPRRRGELVEDIGRDSNETLYARISFEPTAYSEADPPTTIDENIYEYIETPSASKRQTYVAQSTPQPIENPNTTTTIAEDRAAQLRTRYALFKHSTYRHSNNAPPVDHQDSADNETDSPTTTTVIEGAIEKLKLQLKTERDSYEGAQSDEAVMLRLNAMKRYPRLSQLRGSGMTAAAAFCMITDIQEEPNIEERHAVSEVPREAKFPYGKGGSFRV